MSEEEKTVTEEPEGKSFAELLDESYQAPVKLKPGDKTSAKIFRITDEWIFLDLGGKSEGCLSKAELMDEDGDLTVVEGDLLEVFFLSETNSEMLFTTKLGKGSADKSQLEDAYRNSIPVEGSVEKEIKGGFSIKLSGSVQAFCPYSQMGLRRVENAEQYVGSLLSFMITEFSEKGKNIVLSNRAVLEEEQMKKREVLKGTLKKGNSISGTITSIRDFGAFIDIGGAEGLIPISEIGWARVESINDYLSVGQKVEVEIIKLDWDNNRLSFSLKARQPDPWERSSLKYSEGSIHPGKVSRLANFGAFITLEPGIDGLLHISRIGNGKRINHPGDVLKAGQEIMVKVEKLDPDNRRISLALDSEDSEVDDKQRFEEHKKTKDISGVDGKSTESFGTLGDILKAKLAVKNK